MRLAEQVGEGEAQVEALSLAAAAPSVMGVPVVSVEPVETDLLAGATLKAATAREVAR